MGNGLSVRHLEPVDGVAWRKRGVVLEMRPSWNHRSVRERLQWLQPVSSEGGLMRLPDATTTPTTTKHHRLPHALSFLGSVICNLPVINLKKTIEIYRI